MKRIIYISILFSSLTAYGQSKKIDVSDTSYFYPETTFLKSELSDGSYEVYRDPSMTKIYYKGQIQNQLRNGSWIWYDESGNILKETNYKDGPMADFYKEYYSNGQLKLEINIINGFPDGTMTEWWPKGIKKSEGSFVEGAKQGTWKLWDESGSLIEESQYTKGVEEKP